ncbi:MFS general substrate transporter [Saccharata proteae CBS 121410]|uniref:MFS general substrate transporter n=1 Tax=Saccharata proteae CBS 121410 TaxID=1314787 RepID=A0A9P4HWD7_9PEZI|nr:MFS general substrate transporter [Saccharata proteae CBS 121410]
MTTWLPLQSPVRHSVFTPRQKAFIVTIASIAALFSPLTANIYFPALNRVANDLHVSTEQINLTVTAYMIFQGIAPTFWGSLTDRVGRRPVYIFTFLVFIVASVGCALANVYWLLLVLRMLQATGSASVVAIGSGTISDISTPAERAGNMGFFAVGLYAGPAIGPFLGGVLTEGLGWRSLFWFLVITGSLYTIVLICFLPETMRKKVGNGSHQSSSKWKLPLMYSLHIVKMPAPEGPLPPPQKKYMNPLRSVLILKEKDVFLILFFNAIIYTSYYTITSSTTQLFASAYNLNSLQIGLCFLANGIGAMGGSVVRGKLMDRSYRLQREKWQRRRTEEGGEKDYDDNDISTFNVERTRLKSLPYYYFLNIGTTIAYGWFVQYRIHLAAPVIMQFFIGLSSTSIFGITNTMIMDIYPSNAASAIATNNLTRCLMGAAGVALIDKILQALNGPGWTFTMIALICLATFPMPLAEYRWGFKWRAERATRLEEKSKEKDGERKTE